MINLEAWVRRITVEMANGDKYSLVPEKTNPFPDPKPDPEPIPDPDPKPEPIPSEFITYLHSPEVAKWPETSILRSVSIAPATITLFYQWPYHWKVRKVNGVDVVANAWVIIEISGKLVASTWEYLRPGQVSKSKNAVAGDHIKQPKYIPLDWRPVPGDRLGFFVSGLCRGGARNVEEKTNIIWETWQ